ncbi:hypothetical protein [Streptomyces sp. NPDC002545]
MPKNNERCPRCQNRGGYHLMGGPFDGRWQCSSCGYVDRDGVTNTTHDWPGRMTDEDQTDEELSPASHPSTEELAALEEQLEEERDRREAAEQRAETHKVWAWLAAIVLALFMYASCNARSGPANPDAPDCQFTGRATECW